MAHRAEDGLQEVCRLLIPYLISDFYFVFCEVEVLSWLSRAALELIGRGGLGYSFDPLTEDGAPHPYSIATKLLPYVYFPEITAVEFSC